LQLKLQKAYQKLGANGKSISAYHFPAFRLVKNETTIRAS